METNLFVHKFNQGIETLGKNDLKAVEAFTKAIELDPLSAKAHYFRGVTHFLLSDYSRAVKDFDRAVELDSNYKFQTYYNRELANSYL